MPVALHAYIHCVYKETGCDASDAHVSGVCLRVPLHVRACRRSENEMWVRQRVPKTTLKRRKDWPEILECTLVLIRNIASVCVSCVLQFVKSNSVR